MRVMFVCGDDGRRFVRYRPAGLREEQWEESPTVATTYERRHMCDYPANDSVGWRHPGFVFDGIMKGLQPGRRYLYKVGSDSGGWSETYSFISRDNEANETTAFLFGDLGTYVPYNTYFRTPDESLSTVKWILRDLEALGGKPAIEPIAAKTPYHVCIGSHEYDWPSQPWKPSWAANIYSGKDGGGECGIAYSIKFRMPGNSSFPTGTGAPDTRNLYYSFDAGVVHFVYMSTETDFTQGSDQYNFVKADLERVNRSRTPFIVFQGHRPMYERFCPMKNYQCLNTSSSFVYPGSPAHVVIGMAGQGYQPSWEPRPDDPNVPIFPQPQRSMYRGGEFGYTKLVATRKKLTLTYIGNHNGRAHDKVEIFSLQVGNDSTPDKLVSAMPKNTRYVEIAGCAMLALLLGFMAGFGVRKKTDSARWTPVRNEES
ncbi:putative inactive purple acid phosphatase 2 [Panicum miliaceum]|uniref:Inactive purple acid phosphatase 2 n=1 Tax=Panicum miliaceum TaxID=4540 RepID=A0A3L6S2I1_PANMI|nr:putative inactive purple acid phosphatase 2 [Panicum miliaceum]